MALVNRVEQRAYLDRLEIIRLQLLTYCFFKSIYLTQHELECLALLAQDGETDLNKFCRYIERKELYASAQSARNTINRLERAGLVTKLGKKNKQLRIHDAIALQTEGNILLEYKFAHLHETDQV
jgi:chromosome condensin MukBEF MukE localization factor